MEMRCYRRILHISYKDHATNEEVRAKIQQAIGPHEYLLTIVKRRKLQWCGHVPCSSGLAKTILQGKVKGGRRQGGQRKRWEDNIREWTGLEFGKSQRTVENGEEWRKLVAKSSVVPKRPYDDDDDCTAKEPIITILQVNSYDIVGEEYVNSAQNTLRRITHSSNVQNRSTKKVTDQNY